MPELHNMEPYQYDFYTSSPSFVSSPSSTSPSNTDGHIYMPGGSMSSPSSNMSPISNQMSPVSTSENSSMYTSQNLQASSTTEHFVLSSINEPFLEITVKPIDKFRFRYKSEMHGTHGSLTGQGASRPTKRYPTVRLHNFDGEALIRCSLYQIPKSNGKNPLPHSHSLIIRNGNEDRKDPHEVVVSHINNYTAIFQGMGIIHTARSFIENELFQKLIHRKEFELGRDLTHLETETLRTIARNEKEDMNLNQVTLCFDAFEYRDERWIKICKSVFSNPINNMKSALTGELKISRLSTVAGNAAGNDDLFMFVEKVGKKNIKVRFFEMNGDCLVWEDWGKFTEADVHHQYAIALKTPPYRSKNIEETVKVFIQLLRPGDDAASAPVEFRYKPSYNMNCNRKRPRITSEYNDIPIVVNESSVPQISDANMSDNCNFEDLSELFDSVDNFVSFTSEEYISILKNCGWENMNIEDDNLARDSVLLSRRCGSKLDDQRKNIFRLVAKMSALVDAVGTTEDEKKLEFMLSSLLTTFLSDRDSIFHTCLRINDDKLLNQLWKILHRFKLYGILNFRNDRHETSLHIAAHMNNTNLIEDLIKNGADVNAIDHQGDTVLHITIERNNVDSVSVILDRSENLDLNIGNFDGHTPLHLAVMQNNVMLVKMLECKGNDCGISIFELNEGKHGNSALHIAIESESTEVAKYIIENKCINPNRSNQSGHTALYLARTTKSNDLINMMQMHNLCDTQHYKNDDDKNDHSSDEHEKDDDQSSIELFNSTTEISSTHSELLASNENETNTDEMTQSLHEENRFDECCFIELGELLNKNLKWKSVAQELGYDELITPWQSLRNPTKVLLIYTESLKVAKKTLADIFRKIGEKKAVESIEKLRIRR